MCGLNCIVSTRKDKEKVIKKMNNRIIHRGPDSEGIYIDDNIALGHRRLSIIDITDKGNQPIYNEDKSILIVFNGEIYNYKELKKDLNNHKFYTNTDTEVLVHGYEEWGYNLPSKLRGMFSFIIYDKNNNKLFIARDHFGQKPLYYYKTKEDIIISSEIKSFLEYPSFKKELNKKLLGPYLTFSFTPTEETFFKNVYRLPQGHYMEIDINTKDILINRYFKPEFKKTNKSYNEMVNIIEKTIKDSIKHHLISDVEIGSFLSSGIDSSYIVSESLPNKTYTVGYNIDKYNEIEYAKDLTKRLNIDNINYYISKEEYINIIPKVMYHLDEPTSDACSIAFYFLSKLASKDVKVVLSGEGADEFFGGYNTYNNIYTYIPLGLRKSIANISKLLPKNKYTNYLVRRGLSLEEGYVSINRNFYDDELEAVLNFKDYIKNKDILKDTYEEYKDYNTLDKMLIIDIKYWLSNNVLEIVDKITMANSVESRVPFTDIEVFKVSSSLPYNYKIRDNTTKKTLRDAAKRTIPNESYKKKKLGFPVPIRDWIKEEDTYLEIKNTFSTNISKELFNNTYILKLLEDHKNNKKDNYRKIWAIYSFLKWYQVFFIDNGNI